MRRLLWLVAVLGCSERTQILLEYRLGNIDLGSVVRLETLVAVDPSDPRGFFANQPYRSVAEGVGLEVGDYDHSGKLKVLITHDSTLGFVFAPSFEFTLLPPSGQAPPLLVSARAVGASAMLGRTDELPTHFAPGARLTVALTDKRCHGVACATGESCCNDQCINTLSDAAHCGGCGMACDTRGDSCQGGGCLCAGGTACGGATSCCSGVGCVDLMADPFNCGACGNACNPGETCSAGACGCNGGAACGAGVLCCATTGCSTTGSCPCGAQPCAAPNVCCDAAQGICVNLMNDGSNCGSCGHACGAGLTCQNGACTCSGQICSPTDTCCTTGCANLMSSTANCGMCGHSCVPNEVCAAGACQCGSTTCNTGQSCCGTSCKDLGSDEMNCGECGQACNPGEECVSGACLCNGTVPPRGCSPGETCCGGSGLASGGCFDLSSDQNHCGSCTNPCSSTQQCIMGVCQQTGCNPPCSNGNSCGGALVCNCGGQQACTDPNFCCSGTCVDKLTDPKNCGACGNDVSPNLCCGGHATPIDELNCGECAKVCNFNQFCCPAPGGITCVNNDVNHCGGCNKSCPPPDRPLATICCACGRMGNCSTLGCLPCNGGP